jgi:CheY-like chemotaxis protein
MSPNSPDPAATPSAILIVDDTEMQRRILCAIVEGLGMHAHVVESGDAAVAFCKARRAPIDAILMDIEMPGLNGFDATRAIRGLDGPSAKTPVIAVTASACGELSRKARRAGINMCLEKPVRPADVAHALRAVLMGPEALRA